MKLYFMRHGEAVDVAPTDHDRELTERGVERTEKAAQGLAKLKLKPEAIFASPRVRAQQTATIVAQALGRNVTTSEDVNFDFNVKAVHRLIESMEDEAEVMFVGHNPSMSVVVNQLTGAQIGMKKGGIARVDLFAPESVEGELVWLLTPKIFDALV